ncbi:MAG: PAS domain-containing protein [Puniceicoccaceae bacterium]
MSFDIKGFQLRYVLSNKEMADICKCSLPTIQKWRSGEVSVSGAASQLLRMLDLSAEGDPNRLRELLSKLDKEAFSTGQVLNPELDELESSMSKVVDRLEVMLESRRKEKELAESEARYRSMLQSFVHPVCRWLPDTTITYANAAYGRLFGTESSALLGKKWLELLPAEKRADMELVVSDMVRRAEEEIGIHELPDAAGNIRYFEWREIPVKNERGELVEFHSIAHEVTELLELRRRMEHFDAAKAAIFASAGQPVLIFDDAGRCMESNENFRLKFGCDENCRDLTELLPRPAFNKLMRLLKRLTAGEEVCFQVMVAGVVYLMNIRQLASGAGSGPFLAVFQTLRQEQESKVMQVRLQHEVILQGEKHQFLMEEKLSSEVRAMMAQLGRAVQGHRIYVFTLDEGERVFDNILEWCADGINPHIDELQRIPMSEYPWWMGRLRKQQWIIVEDTTKLPRNASRERDILMAQDIRSIMVAPLLMGGGVVGFAGIDHNHTTRIWHQQERQELETFKGRIEQLLAGALINSPTF